MVFLKEIFIPEPYLLRLQVSDRIYMYKLRCSNLKFSIETCRWANIPKEQRICHLCNIEIGNHNEYH